MRKLSRSGGSDGFQKVVDPTKKLSKRGGFYEEAFKKWWGSMEKTTQK